MAACAKHFPGHGDTEVDSHLDLPSLEHPRSRLEEVELVPFRACVEAGVALVMTAHVLVPELDETRPGTLSPEIVGGLLRGELGYGGVVATDDLQMKAVAAHWGAAERAVLAAQAGCDLLEVCSDHDDQVEAMEGLIRAVEAEEIGFKDMEAAEGRVTRLKERFLEGYRDPDPREARLVGGRGRAPGAGGGDRRAVGTGGLSDARPASPAPCGPATSSGSRPRRGRWTRSGSSGASSSWRPWASPPGWRPGSSIDGASPRARWRRAWSSSRGWCPTPRCRPSSAPAGAPGPGGCSRASTRRCFGPT